MNPGATTPNIAARSPRFCSIMPLSIKQLFYSTFTAFFYSFFAF